MGSGVGAYVTQVDRVLAAGTGLFPQGGPGVSGLGAGGGGAPTAPPGGSGLSVGAGGAAQDYRGSWAQVGGLDGDVDATAGAGRAAGEDGRAVAQGVRGSAQSAAAAIAPAAGSPAGMRTLVSTMDQRMADMQRQIDTAKAQNALLTQRMRQMAMAYRAMGAGLGGGGARSGVGGLGGMMPSLGGLGGGGIPGMSALSGLPATLTGLRGPGGSLRSPGGVDLDTAGSGSGGPAAARAVAFARTKIGKPYVWGAVGPNGYDCSGLVMDAYRHAGISLPHHTYEQMRVGSPVSREHIQAGDRIYANFSGPGQPEHVLLAISPTMAIEAPTPGQRVHITNVPLGRIAVRRCS